MLNQNNPKINKASDFNQMMENLWREMDMDKKIPKAVKPHQPLPQEKKRTKAKKSQSDLLIEFGLSKVDTFFTDQRGTAFAKFNVNGHIEVWPIRSKIFKRWLCNLFFEATQKGANSEAVGSALNTLESKAFFEGVKSEIFNRVGQYHDVIFYDLSDERWQVVKITKDGWDIVSNPPILFRRYGHQKPQMLPSKNGDIKLLLPFLNLKNEDDKNLFLIWLISCFIPHIPHPIPVLFGSQGSAKSTLLKLAKMILDPSITLLSSMPKDISELVQTLDHHWFVPFDNLSSLRDWQSDALCRAVTGEGFSKRQLYTDDEDIIFCYKRCIGLNGINCVAAKPDLLDRAILFELNRIEKEKRKEEGEIWSDFYKVLPRILGGCFDTLSKTISIFHSVRLNELERMADFTRWGFAIAEALDIEGSKFLQAYRKNIKEQHEEVVEANPVGLAIKKFMEQQKEWEGRPSELLTELNKMAEDLKIDIKDKTWPKQPSNLSKILNILKTNLEETGIDYHRKPRSKTGSIISLKVREIACTTYTPTPTQKNQGFSDVGKGVGKMDEEKVPTPQKARTDEENVSGVSNVGKIPTLKNNKNKSGGGYLVIKPFSWRGRNYLQGSLIKEGDFTLGELQTLKDAAHIKPIEEDKDILISF